MIPPAQRSLSGLCGALIAAALASAPGAAFADRLVWLSPERVLPGPLEVALVRLDARGLAVAAAGAQVAAKGATLSEQKARGPLRLFTLQVGDAPVELGAQAPGVESASKRIEVGPPGATVRVVATPPKPVKGRDTDVQLDIDVLGAAGEPDPDASEPIVRANVGEISSLEALGGGRFRARYKLPAERYPEVATVVAFAPWPDPLSTRGAFGRALLPLATAVKLPGRTEPNVNISLEIAGEKFGPVQAGPDGSFELPVVVPPGHRTATSIAVDRVGNQRRKRIDLPLPPTDQLECVSNPVTLPADGVSAARVLCVATDPFGLPVDGAKLQASATLGKLTGPRARGGGVYEWEYLAPADLRASADTVSVLFPAGGPASRDEVHVNLAALTLAHATLTADADAVFADGTTRVTVTGSDRLNRPVAPSVELQAQAGRLDAFQPGTAGKASATYHAPATAPADRRETLKGVAHAPAALLPARLLVRLEQDGVLAHLENLGGQPLPGAVLRAGAEKGTTDRDGNARFALPAVSSGVVALPLRAERWPSLQRTLFIVRSAEGLAGFPADPWTSALPLSLGFALLPPPPVDVRVEALSRTQLTYRVVDPSGRALAGRNIAVVVRGATGELKTGTPRPQGDGSVVVPIEGAPAGSVAASVTDVATGVSAARQAEAR